MVRVIERFLDTFGGMKLFGEAKTVAERRSKVAVGFSPRTTVDHRHRVAERRSRAPNRLGSSVAPRRRDREIPIRGLKPTATVIPSLRDGSDRFHRSCNKNSCCLLGAVMCPTENVEEPSM